MSSKAIEKGYIYKERRKNLAIIEQMCGIILLLTQRTDDEVIVRELTGMLNIIKELEPSGALEIKRIDKYIISKLDEIKTIFDIKNLKERVLVITADIGLQLLERKRRLEKK